jgi:hypothetical protein
MSETSTQKLVGKCNLLFSHLFIKVAFIKTNAISRRFCFWGEKEVGGVADTTSVILL